MLKQSLAALFAVCGMVITSSALADAELDYKPYDGTEGYEDIHVSDRLYYVGYHGKSGLDPSALPFAWATRSAELCAAIGAKYFVELEHLLEPLTDNERKRFIAYDQTPYTRYVKSYRIIIIPNYSARGGHISAALSKLAPVRCLYGNEELLDRPRAISVEDSLTAAKEAGLILLKPASGR
jgi:hypothetical protein